MNLKLQIASMTFNKENLYEEIEISFTKFGSVGGFN